MQFKIQHWQKLILFFPLLVFGCGLGLFELVPGDSEGLPTAIPPVVQGETAQTGANQPPTATPIPEPTATATPTITPTSFFLKMFSTSRSQEVENVPRHGLFIAFILPLVVFGIPWLFFELFAVRYVQPRGVDLTTVKAKAQDGLFVEATISMTARRTLTLAATRMTWPRVRDLVEKDVEQEFIQEAVTYPTLDDLERNLKAITEKLYEANVVRELSRDFGVEVLRFNIQLQYTPETMDSLQRKAEASAGGTAYLSYVAAAHLDPDRPESRELYRIYQETTSQVDAARNLGGGIAGLARLLSQRVDNKDMDKEDDPDKK